MKLDNIDQVTVGISKEEELRLEKLEKSEKINRNTLKFGGFTMMLSYLPQILQVWRSGSSEGISLAFIAMVTIALSTFTYDGYVVWKRTGNKGTMYAQLANLIPAIILVISIIVTRM